MRKQVKRQTNQNFSDSIKISSSKNSTKNREKTSQLENYQQDSFVKQDFLADLQNLNIEPIENKTGDKFVIDEIDESSRSYSSKFTNRKDQIQELQFAQSTVWPDVFYGKKNIMSLLQQRNDVCEMYKLNSKSLKQSNTQASKRVYSDSQIVQYVKQLFSQSPSYEDYDSMCFTVIPQITLQTQKYFVFMSSDLKFVPQCKICNFTAHLILNIQKQGKNTKIPVATSDKSSFIKGKILCSFKNCKKSLLGQFMMSHYKNIKNKTQVSNFYDSKFFSYQNTNNSLNKIERKPETEKKKQPQLSERQKMMIKKAAFKINS